MSTVEPAPATADSAECEHALHEWPVTGPWVDYTCARCGQDWRLPWGLALAHLDARER